MSKLTRRQAALNMATWNEYLEPRMGFSHKVLNDLVKEGILSRVPTFGMRGKVFYRSELYNRTPAARTA